MKEPEEDLKEVMAEEGSRGRRRPVRATDLEFERQRRKVLRMLTDSNCDKRRFMAALREFGYQDDSPMFRKFLKAWDDFRGVQ